MLRTRSLRLALPLAVTAALALSALALGWRQADRMRAAIDFGDGGTEEGENLVYAYSKPGTCTVRITATDGAGNARTVTRTITISAVPGPRT